MELKTRQHRRCTKYEAWTDEENARLVKSAEAHRTSAGKIDWTMVQIEFSNRSQTQLRSQYSNKLKQTATYTKWSMDEK